MKGSFRRMFTLLLLVAIGTSWIFGTVVLRRFHGIPLRNSGMTRLKPEHYDLDTTLHKLAEIDLGEDQMKQEVDKLFENKNPRGSRSLWSQFPNVNIQLRSTTGRINLNDPMFHRIWLDFRELLGGWFRNKRFQPEVMSELINLVKHPIDEYHSFVDVSNRRYSSCAVVGNSGILLKTEYGDLIDSHEVVIRLNNARIEGYERNVGSKTSISFINSNILHQCGRRVGCSCHPYGKKVPTLVYTCQALHFMDYLLCNSPYKAPLLVTDARFDVLCARIVKYYSLRRFVEETGKAPEEWSFAHTGSNFHYSSGMQAIMLALGICDSVSIFGFGKSTTAKHHYHTNQKSELLMHDYEAEYAFYHDLIKKPRVIPFLMENFTIPSVVLHH